MAIAFVQSVSTHGTGNQNALFSGDNTAGNIIIAAGCFAGSSGTSSVLDDAGNAYVPLASFLNGAGTLEMQVFYALNIAGPLRGVTNSVTFTPGTAGVNTGLAIHEFSGLDSFDVQSHNSGTGTSQTSNSASTNFANELLFGFTAAIIAGLTSSIASGAGYTQAQALAQNSATLVSFLTEYQIVSSTGSFAATTTASAGKSGTVNWGTQIATFYQAAAGGVPNALMTMGVG